MEKDILEYYLQKITIVENGLKVLAGKLKMASFFRLISFLGISFSVFKLFQQFSPLWIVAFLIFFAAFLVLISFYVNLKNKEKYQQQLLFLYQNELEQLNGKSNKFNDGSAFDTGESYWGDLDLFGKGSLYHLINRTVTQYGQEALAKQFKFPYQNIKNISEQQKALQIYSKQLPIVESIIATALLHRTELGAFDTIFKWLKTPNSLHNSNWAKMIRWVLPAINICLIALAFIKGSNAFIGLVFIAGWIQIVYYGKYLQNDFALLGKKEDLLKQYASILQKFESIVVEDSELLKQYQSSCSEAYTAIKALSKLSSRIDQRLNLLIITIVNPIFLYDIQNMFSLESWKMKYRDSLNGWINTVGEIEKLNSFAVYAFQNQENCYPKVLEGVSQINAKAISHPLIPKNKKIPNDISIGVNDKLLLITGSNMSGKTTFLRTLAVNLVMAESGLPVAATDFSFTPMQIFSSIRISDSLQENTSYFMAELKKLQSIKTGVQQNQSSLVLIDEILRGTNSDDKFYGSEQFVKEMIRYNCITLFATHDLKLSELENEFPDQIVNHCFESKIENNELSFDYKIQRGVAKNRNASFLMKKMGII